ncbi:MAG: carboxypeptidase regulatory-like domain-containing protein [Verrucomicrobiota bacterium]
MKNSVRFIALLTLATAIHFASAADITGTITLKGTPPPEKDIQLTADCGVMHKSPVKTRFYSVNDKAQLADVVVILKGANLKGSAAAAKPATLDQHGCEYLPYVTAVQAGQKVLVKNSDPLMHNVHPIPVATGNKEVNKAQMPKSPDLEFVFETPEQFLKFKCDVHPWMFAYVTVVDHPYFAVTGKDGSYKIANVPPGKYTVEAYHRKAAPAGTPATKEVEVKEQSATADFVLEVK